MPIRWYHGTFGLDGRRVRLPTAAGCAALWLRLDRDIPYPLEQVRSVTLLAEGGRLWIDVTAELPVTAYRAGEAPDPGRVAGVDLGIIHPYAVAGPDGQALLVSGRAMRAEHRLHLADTKNRRRAVARRAPIRGQRGSRRVRQAQHEAAKTVVAWAVEHRVGILAVGDPRGVLNADAGRRHNLRLRQWQIGRAMALLTDKATLAGITVQLVDERGSSSTCPGCRRRISKPAPPGGAPTTSGSLLLPAVVTHRRAGRHLPGVRSARRDPRRHHHPGGSGRRVGWPAVARPTSPVGSRSTAPAARIHNTTKPGER